MRPTRAVVDLGKIAHNVNVLHRLLAPGVQQMAVVKADGYGHGALPVAETALKTGANWLGVALVEEGRDLRAAGIEAPILVLGPVAPDSAAEAIGDEIALAAFSRELVEALDDRAAALGRDATVHVKVDTGMGRVGLQPDQVLPFLEWLAGRRRVRLGGVFSHLSTADEDDLSFARQQLGAFREILEAIAARGISVPLRHIANTAGTMVLPESHLDLVRTGIGIYGLYPSPEIHRTVELRQAMVLTTRIGQLKEVPAGTPLSYGRTFVTERPSRIATLPVGYGDGYPRLLSNRGRALVRGVRTPIVGRVCMDMTLIDVSQIPSAEEGDEVILFGRQGDAEILVDEIACLTGTINYEVTCNIGKRVPRHYREG